MMRSEYQTLPRGTFLHLAIGKQTEDSAWLTLQGLTQRDPVCQRQTVAQAPGGKGNLRKPSWGRMTAEVGIVAVKTAEIVITKTA
jgi:hypothetical protein